MAEKSVRETLDEVSKMQQKEGEAVLTFYARLNAKLIDIKFHIPLSEIKELFVSGLNPDLKKMVRVFVSGEITLEKTLEIAKARKLN